MPEMQPAPTADRNTAAGGLGQFERLESRVVAIAEKLREARAARREAEAEASRLCAECRVRDAEIARLRHLLEDDGLRVAVRARVAALLHRVAELELGSPGP